MSVNSYYLLIVSKIVTKMLYIAASFEDLNQELLIISILHIICIQIV